MKEFNAKNKKRGLFFRFCAKIVSWFYRGSEFIGLENLPDEPCVIAGNHAKLHGPVMGQLYLPFKKLMWCDGPMMYRKEFPKYAHSNFFNGKPTRFQRFIAKFLAPLVTYLMRNADALPVYRDMRVVKTYKYSVEAMNEGYNIVIFPECPEKNNEIVNKLNEYFVDVARFYYKQTGKELLFVPMYYSVELRKVLFAKPIKFDASSPIDEQRKKICSYIMDEITGLAKTLPVHTVIPFNNVPKSEYKKSK